MLIRQYLWDWQRETPAEFRIYQLEAQGRRPSRTSPCAWRACSTRRATGSMPRRRCGPTGWRRSAARTCRVGSRRRARFAGGADDILYGNDAYRLGPGEALIFEFEPPDARYWHVQLVDLWFGSLDYANRQTSLNGHQLRRDADGRVRVVVAHEDPGVPNWLDTAGHREGILQYRYVWTRNEPVPRARIVPFDGIRAALPPDTPRVTPPERRRAIAGRQAHVARRERS